MMRKWIAVLLVALITFGFSGIVSAGEAADLVEDIPTVQAFTDEAVKSEDIDRIINAGINSPSAMNKQPWHFSVVTDRSTIEKVAGEPSDKNAPVIRARPSDAPLLIIVSCKEGSEFDAGLATQAMSVEAQLLGYGTKIFLSPVQTINDEAQQELRNILGIPEEQKAAAVLAIGTEDVYADILSTATVRYSQKELVTYILQ